MSSHFVAYSIVNIVNRRQWEATIIDIMILPTSTQKGVSLLKRQSSQVEMSAAFPEDSIFNAVHFV